MTFTRELICLLTYLSDLFDDVMYFVGWHLGFSIIVLVGFIGLLLLCLHLINKSKREKLSLAYDLIPDDVNPARLHQMLGKPTSQFLGANGISYHYEFWSGLRRGVCIYTFDRSTDALVDRQKLYF